MATRFLCAWVVALRGLGRNSPWKVICFNRIHCLLVVFFSQSFVLFILKNKNKKMYRCYVSFSTSRYLCILPIRTQSSPKQNCKGSMSLSSHLIFLITITAIISDTADLHLSSFFCLQLKICKRMSIVSIFLSTFIALPRELPVSMILLFC